ncbi:ATP-binding protein [Scytonema millei]|uniref:histidine kinase n=1 Tax=Scytonema millei VB511283 TaxID=1245923 RepID=A0A9X5E3P7_9CYAN|nr:ATP-binding protein [Scytonema millei]NHC34218.1 PAS domain-containing protein [Scytonema millei VB511283]
MQPGAEQDGVSVASEYQNQRVLEVLSSLSYRTGELSGYLQEIAQGVSELIRLDWSTITLCRDGFERVIASTIDIGEAAERVYSLHGTLTGTVIATGVSLVVEDTQTCTDYGEAPAGYQAYLGVPLRTPVGEVIGTICSFQRQPRHFSAAEIRLAEIFAERAATAIDNYQMYQQQQQMNQQLQVEIEERRATEKMLRESEERLRQIAENMHQVLWMYSHDRQPIYISPAFEQIWQRSCESWYANPQIWQDTIHPEDRQRVDAAFQQTMEFSEEYRIVRPDGSVRIIFDQAFPIWDAAGQIYRLAGIAEDITERKQAQQEMVKAIASLAEVGELAATIVHELRNPLTTVLMGLNAFKRIDLPPTAKERLDLSLDEAERIRNLLNEILLYAKPQVLQFAQLELNSFIAGILPSLRTMPSAMRRRIEFFPTPTPIEVLADANKLKQVFINLVDNACEAVKDDEVISWQVELEETAKRVKIYICNGGDCIPPEILPKLTKPFYTTKLSGTGLGLSIVKRIVEAHGGEFAIASSTAEGTIVSVQLPVIDYSRNT